MIPVVFQKDTPEALFERIQPFGLPAVHETPASGQYLQADASGIALCKVGEKGRVRVDFTGGAAQYRRTKGGGELLGKAVNHTGKPVVWDATGGLGRDSFVLASLGLRIQTFEQNPAAACMLADGLARAVENAETAEIAARITLHFGHAAGLMAKLAEREGRPHVVYLDPMYPGRQKSAAVKKEMAFFHELIGLSDDDAALLEAARSVATKRVVVKRPRLGEYLAGAEPDYRYTGKSTRFDVYLPFHPEYHEE